MNLEKLDFYHYRQYTPHDWSDGTIFNIKNLKVKNAYDINLAIYESLRNNSKYRFLGLMIFFKWASIHNFFDVYSLSKSRELKKLVNNVWSAYFYSEYYDHNVEPLAYAYDRLLEVVDNKLMSKAKIHYNNHELDKFFEPKNIISHFKNCVYRGHNVSYLGEVIQPAGWEEKKTVLDTLFNQTSKLFTSIFSDTTQKVEPSKKVNTMKIVLPKETQNRAYMLQQQASSTLGQYPKLGEEEKIIFAEDYLAKYCAYPEANTLINEIKKIYVVNKKYVINNLQTQVDYAAIIDKHLYDLLGFVDLYRNKKLDRIQNQIKMLTKLVEQVQEDFDEEIHKIIDVKNRYLNDKSMSM